MDEFRRAGLPEDPVAAEVALRLVLRDRPEDHWALEELGVLMARQGRFGEAKELLDRLVDLGVRHARLFSNLGNVYLETGDYESAVSRYEQAINADPNYAAAHQNLAIAYRRMGNFTAYVAEMRRSARAVTWRSLGSIRKRFRLFRRRGE